MRILGSVPGGIQMNKLAFLFMAGGLSVSIPALAAYSIIQGSTSESETWITMVAPAAEKLRIQAGAESDPVSALPIEVKRVEYPGSQHVVYRIKIVGLSPQTPYVLEVLDDRGRVADRRAFKALDPKQANGRVAVGSCMLRQLHNPYLWSNLAREENRPDLLIILGDLVYLDRAKLLRGRPPQNGLEAWEEFVRSRNAEGLYFWENLVPTLSVWDDHDAGGDGVDSSFELLREIRYVYDTFTANDPVPGFIDAGPGMARSFQLFGKNWILMDSRTFREDSPSNPLFGHDQNKWMLRNLKSGPNFILSGTQFYGAPIRKDSLEYNWPEFAIEWTKELREHAEWKRATLAFVSGDVHFSEVQELEPELFGYWSVEITASNIHSFGFPGHHYLKPNNPRRRVATGTHNMVLLEFTDQGNGFGFLTRALGWRGNDLFRTVVSIGGLQPSITVAQESGCEKLLQTNP